MLVVTSMNFIISTCVFDELTYAHVSNGKYTYNALAAYRGSEYVCVVVYIGLDIVMVYATADDEYATALTT